MAASTSLKTMNMVILIAESLLYGTFLVLFASSFKYLLHRHRHRPQRATTILVGVAVLLACLLTAHLGLDIAHASRCFVSVPDVDSSACFEDLTDRRYLASSILFEIITVIGDTFLAYRLYIIWGRKLYIVIFPAMLIIALATTHSLIMVHLADTRKSLYTTEGPLITCVFALLLTNNLFCTPLIAYRIWESNSTLSSAGLAPNRRTLQIMHTLVQSAAIYSTCLLLNLVLYASNNNVQFVMIAVNSQMVGIVFCMIMLPGMSETLARATRSTASSQGANSLPLRPMTIKITTETHRESGNGLHSKHSELSSDRCAPAGHDSDDADTDLGLKSSIV